MYVPLYFLFGMEAKIFENRDQCNHKNAQLHRYSLVLSLEKGIMSWRGRRGGGQLTNPPSPISCFPPTPLSPPLLLPLSLPIWGSFQLDCLIDGLVVERQGYAKSKGSDRVIVRERDRERERERERETERDRERQTVRHRDRQTDTNLQKNVQTDNLTQSYKRD